MAKFVAYYRVSTSGQGLSGLGLEAQRVAVEAYVDRVGGELVGAFTEVDSGANGDRVECRKAIQACRRINAMLVVAKLDRLARSVHFISELMDSSVDFVVADMPDANRLTIHLIAAVAEYERQVISDRTKSALKRAKASGVQLGNPNAREFQRKATDAAKAKANAFAIARKPALQLLDPDSSLSATRLADVLNAEGIPTPRNGRWSAASVISLRKRIAMLSRS